MSAPVRILACGSPDGGDDAAGLAVVALLPPEVRSAASVEEIRQLSPELLLDDEGATRLVVDCVAGLPPGEVIDLPLDALAATDPRLQPGSSHALSPGQAVAIADRLGGLREEDRFLGIGGSRFALGAEMSPAVAAGLPSLAALIAKQVERLG